MYFIFYVVCLVVGFYSFIMISISFPCIVFSYDLYVYIERETERSYLTTYIIFKRHYFDVEEKLP